MQKPTFLVIGSAKCGTTALASILASHSDCCMSRPKEVSFFQDNIDFKPNPNYEKGWDWYKQAFSHYNGESVIGEATPSYSDRSRSPNTAKRIYEFNPNLKIVYMVRDPLQRQISTWKMQYAFGVENSFPWRREDKWAVKGFDYWMKMQRDVQQWNECCYGYQLAAYEALFPIKNICVSFLEDWKCNKFAEVRRIMTFLGLEPSFWQPNNAENSNRGSDRTIDRPLFRKLRMLPQTKMVVRYFPMSMREWARNTIARTKAPEPLLEISDEILSEFLRYVAKDGYVFLDRYKKALDFWPTVSLSATQLTSQLME